MGRSAASSALTSSSTRGPNPSGRGSNSKSMRADSGSMFPPVTGTRHSFQMTPHSTWSAEWVRIERVPPIPVHHAGHLGAAHRGRRRRRCARPGRLPCARRHGEPVERAGVVGLAAARRVERGPIERHRLVPTVDDHGVEVAEVGVAEVQQLGGHRPDSCRSTRSGQTGRASTLRHRWGRRSGGGRSPPRRRELARVASLVGCTGDDGTATAPSPRPSRPTRIPRLARRNVDGRLRHRGVAPDRRDRRRPWALRSSPRSSWRCGRSTTPAGSTARWSSVANATRAATRPPRTRRCESCSTRTRSTSSSARPRRGSLSARSTSLAEAQVVDCSPTSAALDLERAPRRRLLRAHHRLRGAGGHGADEGHDQHRAPHASPCSSRRRLRPGLRRPRCSGSSAACGRRSTCLLRPDAGAVQRPGRARRWPSGSEAVGVVGTGAAGARVPGRAGRQRRARREAHDLRDGRACAATTSAS